MATVELEKRIQILEPQFYQALSEYLDFLLFKQKSQSQSNAKPAKRAAKTATPERLKTLRRFKGIAPKPHFPVSKYDVYEQ